VGLAFYPMESWVIFPLMVLAGLGRLGLGDDPGALLKTRFGTNEILVSLMLVYVAEQLWPKWRLGFCATPKAWAFPARATCAQYPSAHNAELIAGTGMHWGVVTA
jgi:ABC-type uncharacterized transport system permease subunit